MSITVVVTDSSPSAVNATQLSTTNSFTVIVREVNVAPQLTVPANQTIDELTPLNVSASATDADLPTNSLTFALVSPPAGMTINATSGAITWTPTEGQGPSVNPITVIVTDNNPSAVNATQLSTTNTFTVTVREVNTPPQLTVSANQTIDELTPLNVAAAATDNDSPPNTLTFSLVSPPQGMTINAASGAISWTPSEAQGPSTNTIAVVVTDNSPAATVNQQLSATNTFVVTVREINVPPQLTVPATQTIDELTALNISVTATDSDVPANPLTFSLLSAPTGMTINATSGAISWTPAEAQGPSSNLVTVVVRDTNSAAAINQQFSVTKQLQCDRARCELAAGLSGDHQPAVHFGSLLSVRVVATDSDVPTNTVSLSLVQAPSNVTFNVTSGAITWTPLQSQVGTHTVSVRATDNGTPSLSATQTFQVNVTGEGSRLAIQQLSGGLMQLSITGDIGLNYELQISTNLESWSRLLQFRLDASPYLYIDPASATVPVRFYKLQLIQP
jgi:hypothetical protein